MIIFNFCRHIFLLLFYQVNVNVNSAYFDPLFNELSLLNKRQTHPQTRLDIDLNREPTLEHETSGQPSAIAVQDEERRAPSNSTPLKSKRYPFNRTYNRIHIPEGLTKEEEKEYRHQVRKERARKKMQDAKNSSDPKMLSIVKQKQQISRNMTKRRAEVRERVRKNQATPEDLEWIKKRKQLDKDYYRKAGKTKEQERAKAKRQRREERRLKEKASQTTIFQTQSQHS